MNSKRFIIMCAVAVGMAVLLAVLPLFSESRTAQPVNNETAGSIALLAPAFAKSASAADPAQADFGFILDEAGVTAYTKLDQELDLEYLSSRFKTVQQKSDRFVAGIVPAIGYEDLVELEESGDVQVFLHRDGWIIAYLSRWQPASALIDWVNYDVARLKGTVIENVVRSLADDIGASDYQVSYYDFRYPDAASLILASDRADYTTQSDAFQITIPRGLVVHESSWAHAHYSQSNHLSLCSLDEKELISVNAPGYQKWKFATGEFNEAQLSPGKTHQIALNMDWYGANNTRIYCGVAIVYGEAAQ